MPTEFYYGKLDVDVDIISLYEIDVLRTRLPISLLLSQKSKKIKVF